jgi:La domain
MTDRRRSSAGTKRRSVVDDSLSSSSVVDGLGGWDGHDVIEEEGMVTSPRDTSVPPSSEPSPTIHPVTGARPRIRQVQVREQEGEACRRPPPQHNNNSGRSRGWSNHLHAALVCTAGAAPAASTSDPCPTATELPRTAKRRKSAQLTFAPLRNCSIMSSSDTKRENQGGGGGAGGGGGGDRIPRRTDAVPTEIVESGSGSPDMSDTSVSSSRSSTASNADADRQHRQNDGDDGGENNVASSSLSDGLKTPSPSAVVLAQLARQLEYYFSARNLARDTYVQTLRALNDGCVPVAILSNFAKVKAMLPASDEEARLHAILQATAEHSDLLRVCSIETITGKIATDETPSSATTILAVGPVGNEPLVIGTEDDAMRKSQSLASFGSSAELQQQQQQQPHHYESSPSPTAPGNAGPNTNTIILREVHPDVTESEIRELFCFEGCPAIESVRPDVAHCWCVCSSLAATTPPRNDVPCSFFPNLPRLPSHPISCCFTFPGSLLSTRRRATTCCES